MRFSPVLNLILVILMAGGSSCQRHVKEEQQLPPAELKERLIRANRAFVKSQLDDIDSYIAFHDLKMDSTATGLRYYIHTGPENGPRAGINDIAGIRYRIKLLDGRVCYTADSALYREFNLRSDDMPSGLREGLLLMHKGDKAMFIIPSHLAYGLTGDGDCIPSNAALVVNVSLEKLIAGR